MSPRCPELWEIGRSYSRHNGRQRPLPIPGGGCRGCRLEGDRMRRRTGRPGRQLRWPATVLALAAVALFAAACSAPAPGTSGNGHSRAHSAGASAAAAAASAQVTITPGNGVRDADPSAGITVRADRGTLQNVTIHTSGGTVPGSLSDGGRVWHSTWALDVSQTYRVTATASDGGSRTFTATSRFRTLTPSQ